MKLDWKRIKRTAIQSASGAAVALITVLAGGCTWDAALTAGIEFVATVATAVLMNIEIQAEEYDDDDDA